MRGGIHVGTSASDWVANKYCLAFWYVNICIFFVWLWFYDCDTCDTGWMICWSNGAVWMQYYRWCYMGRSNMSSFDRNSHFTRTSSSSLRRWGRFDLSGISCLNVVVSSLNPNAYTDFRCSFPAPGIGLGFLLSDALFIPNPLLP